MKDFLKITGGSREDHWRITGGSLDTHWKISGGSNATHRSVSGFSSRHLPVGIGRARSHDGQLHFSTRKRHFHKMWKFSVQVFFAATWFAR
jgi:hypothetical protein